MAREKEGYRDSLELLNRRFPDHDMLTHKEVMQVLGYRDQRAIPKVLLPKFSDNGKLCKIHLARYMCG